MYRILKIGLDVHSTNYTICAVEVRFAEENKMMGIVQVAPDYRKIVDFIHNLKARLGCGNQYDIECGYEAGSLGYSLYRKLTGAGYKCTILAPTTMLTPQGTRIKTDTPSVLFKSNRHIDSLPLLVQFSQFVIAFAVFLYDFY